MLKNMNLADFPIIIAAIDPCFSCTDRMISVKQDGIKRKKVMSWEELRLYGIDWYKKPANK